MKPETKKRWSQAACASLAWLCCFCSAALQAAAQTIATQHGGVTFDSAPEAPVVLAPPPVRATGDLVMATLPVAREPIRFYLTFGTVGRYGPYTLSHNARIGPPHATYLLGLVDQGRRFTLTAPHATNTVYGPFATTDGTSVRLARLSRFAVAKKIIFVAQPLFCLILIEKSPYFTPGGLKRAWRQTCPIYSPSGSSV